MTHVVLPDSVFQVMETACREKLNGFLALLTGIKVAKLILSSSPCLQETRKIAILGTFLKSYITTIPSKGIIRMLCLEIHRSVGCSGASPMQYAPC